MCKYDRQTRRRLKKKFQVFTKTFFSNVYAFNFSVGLLTSWAPCSFFFWPIFKLVALWLALSSFSHSGILGKAATSNLIGSHSFSQIAGMGKTARYKLLWTSYSAFNCNLAYTNKRNIQILKNFLPQGELEPMMKFVNHNWVVRSTNVATEAG